MFGIVSDFVIYTKVFPGVSLIYKRCLCPIVQVKRKGPQELEEGDMKRQRPSTPPDEDDEGSQMWKLLKGGLDLYACCI